MSKTNQIILLVSTLVLTVLLLTIARAKDNVVQTVAAPEDYSRYTYATTPPAEAPTTAPTVPTTEAATEPKEEERFLLTFVGDCTLGASPFNYYAECGFIKTIGDDYAYPFKNVVNYFEQDDFTMVNLEGVLADKGNPVKKAHNFLGPTDFVKILSENSVEAVTVANNHTLDYGPKGYESTVNTLKEANLPYVEQDASTIVTTQSGLKIGLYAMMYVKLDVADMTAEIKSLRDSGADVVVVVPHWGIEGNYKPTPEQVDVGHAAIDAGADIVYGSHPHVLQPIEKYGDGVILYSMGNFCFGGNTDPKDSDSAIVQQEVIRGTDGKIRLGEMTIIPASISSDKNTNNYQPTPYEEGSKEYQRVLSKLDGTY